MLEIQTQVLTLTQPTLYPLMYFFQFLGVLKKQHQATVLVIEGAVSTWSNVSFEGFVNLVVKVSF